MSRSNASDAAPRDKNSICPTEATRPIGPQRLALAASDGPAGHGHAFVLASDIRGSTGMGLRAVQDCIHIRLGRVALGVTPQISHRPLESMRSMGKNTAKPLFVIESCQERAGDARSGQSRSKLLPVINLRGRRRLA